MDTAQEPHQEDPRQVEPHQESPSSDRLITSKVETLQEFPKYTSQAHVRQLLNTNFRDNCLTHNGTETVLDDETQLPSTIPTLTDLDLIADMGRSDGKATGFDDASCSSNGQTMRKRRGSDQEGTATRETLPLHETRDQNYNILKEQTDDYTDTESIDTDGVQPEVITHSTRTTRKGIVRDNAIPVPKLTFMQAATVVFAISLLCYCISYDAELVFDDQAAIEENPDVLPQTPLINVFINDFWGTRLYSKKSHKSYRPLTVLSFKLSYYLGGGLNPVWFHVPNIILHAVISVLLLRIFSILFGGYCVISDTNEVVFSAPRSAFLCAVLFAVHPIHTECVAGAVGRADLMCSLLFLLSFLCYINSCAQDLYEDGNTLIIYRPCSFSFTSILTSMFLCFLSVFCKEQGITVLGICSAYDVILACRVLPFHYFGIHKSKSSAMAVGQSTNTFDMTAEQGPTKLDVCSGSCVLVDGRSGQETYITDASDVLLTKSTDVNKEPEGEDEASCIISNSHAVQRSNLYNGHVPEQKQTGNIDESSGNTTRIEKMFAKRPWIMALLKRHVILAATGLFTIGVRLYVMGLSPPYFAVFDNPHSYANGTLIRVLNYNYLYSLNAWLLVHPWWLCCDWSMGCVPVIQSFLDLRILGGAALWLGLGALLCTCFMAPIKGDHRILAMALALLIVPFLPASNVFVRVGFVIAERILYLSSIGFCMLVVVGVRRICAVWPMKAQAVKLGVIFLVGIFIIRCIQRSLEWHNELDIMYAAEKVCPLNAKIHYNIGWHIRKSDRLEEVEERYRLAIELNPEYHNAYNNLGVLLRDRKEYEEAEQMFERAIQIKDDFDKAWASLAQTKQFLKKYKQAELCYETALKIRPKYPKCLFNFGHLYIVAYKDHEKAMGLWWKAIDIDPSLPTGWFNIAVVLHNLERYREATDVLEKGLIHVPGNTKLLFLLADIFKKSRRWNKSEATYLEAIRTNPKEAALYINLGHLYYERKKYEQAEEYYRMYLLMNPDDAKVRDRLAKLTTLI